MALTKITSSLVAINSLTAANIADNAVDATKIASNSILTRHIDDDQITGDQLADNLTIAGTLTSTGAITGTLATAAQTNITSLGTLTSLGVAGTTTLSSTDAGAGAGPVINTYRNSSSPADGDGLGIIKFTGRNDNSQDVVYANMFAETYDVSDGTEDGRFFIKTMVGGTDTHRMYMNFNETNFNESGADIDFRVESSGNANMLFVDGGNDCVQVGGTTITGRLFLEGTGNTTADLSSLKESSFTSYDDNGGAVNSIAGFFNFKAATGIGGGMGVIRENAANWGTALGFYNHPTATSNIADLTERMRIDASGKVGIGTASPSRLLDINSTANNAYPLKIRGNIDNNGGYTGIVFGYESNTTAYEKAAIHVEGTSGSVQPEMHFLLHSGANSSNATISDARLSILNGGNVGIGDNAPEELLTMVAASGDANIRMEGDAVRIKKSGSDWLSYDGSNLKLSTGNNERMRINSSGKLSLNTTGNVGGGMLFTIEGGGEKWGIGPVASNDIFYILNNSNAGVYMNDGSTSFSAHSDERVKENITSLGTVLPSIDSLRCVKYNRIGQTQTKIGFIAQDWETNFSEVVDQDNGFVIDSGLVVSSDESSSTDKVKGVSYTETIPVLLKAIQELSAKNDVLEARITTLEG